MGKKLLSCMIMGCVLLATTITAGGATAHEREEVYELTRDEADDKLKEAFPELAIYIDNANKAVVMSESSETKVVHRQSKEIDEDETVGIAILSDGSYKAYILGDGNKWIGGNSSSGTGYVSMKNRTLVAWQSIGLYQMTIYPVSYTLVNGGYDYFTETGVAATPRNQYLPVSAVQMRESASSPAFTTYIGENVNKLYQSQVISFTVNITVGGDEVYVYVDGYRV